MFESGKVRALLLTGTCLLAIQPVAVSGELQFVRTTGDG